MNDSISTAKNAATQIQKRLAELGVSLTRTQALEAVAAEKGFNDWNRCQANLSKQQDRDVQLIQLSEQPIIDAIASVSTHALDVFTRAPETMHFSDQHLRRITPAINRLALYKFTGGSMEPTIYDGDTLIMELVDDQKSLQRETNDIYLIALYGGLHLVRLGYDPSGILLKRDNPTFDSYLLTTADSQNIAFFFIAKWTGKIV